MPALNQQKPEVPFTESLVSGFLRSAVKYPERPALDVEGVTYTYSQLSDLALRLTSIIERYADAEKRLCGVLAHRSLHAYTGILGTLVGGRGYVPLNPAFPVSRNAAMINASGMRVIIADHQGCELLPDLLPLVDHRLIVLGMEDAGREYIGSIKMNHRFISLSELEAWPAAEPYLHRATKS